MAQTLRDGYSNFKFFQALEPQDYAAGGAALDGVSVDIRGYDTATIVVNVGDNTGGGAFSDTERFQLKLEHYNSAAGAWSECYPSQMIHSVVGMAGAYSTLNSGIFQSITSATQSQAFAVGYKGPHRTIRVAISEVGGDASTMSFGAIAVLGLPGDWPVSTPIGD
jgi:hypothetical protein